MRWANCMLCSFDIQLESPRFDYEPPGKCNGRIASVCISMVDSLWLTILDALSLILTRYVNSFSLLLYSMFITGAELELSF